MLESINGYFKGDGKEREVNLNNHRLNQKV